MSRTKQGGLVGSVGTGMSGGVPPRGWPRGDMWMHSRQAGRHRRGRPEASVLSGGLAWRAATARTPGRRVAWLAAAAGAWGLFAWWWDQALEWTIAIATGTLALGAGLVWRPGRREAGAAALAGAALLGAAAWAWPQEVVDGVARMADVVRYGLPGEAEGWEVVGNPVMELQRSWSSRGARTGDGGRCSSPSACWGGGTCGLRS